MKIKVTYIDSSLRSKDINFKVPAFYVKKSGRDDCSTRLLSLKLVQNEIVVTEMLDTSIIEIKQWRLPNDTFPERYINDFHKNYDNLENEISEEEYVQIKKMILNKI